MKNIISLVLLVSIFSVNAQKQDSTQYSANEKNLYLLEGDSVAVESFRLKEVVILKNLKFKDRLAYNKYQILKRKVRKVYPYAKLASDTLTKIVKDLEDIKKKRHKKKHVKKMQRYLKDRFSEELKKMKRSEGRILIKLIHRQTGRSMFDLIKEYRNGFQAFIYQKTASLFDITLKLKYNPDLEYEDYQIEHILQKNFQEDYLQEQNGPKKYDILELGEKWKYRKPTPVN